MTRMEVKMGCQGRGGCELEVIARGGSKEEMFRMTAIVESLLHYAGNNFENDTINFGIQPTRIPASSHSPCGTCNVS